MRGKDPARLMIAVLAIGVLVTTLHQPANAQDESRYSVARRTNSAPLSQGMAAIDAAARDGKYLFVFFWKTNDKQNQSMYGVFQTTMAKWTESANSIAINLNAPNEKPMVDKFGVSRAPVPLVVAVAPNGAVTKGLPIKFDENQLRDCFVSNGTARCLKCLQDKKLVLVCVQNTQTKHAHAAMNAVQQFKADTRFAKAAEIVTINPADPTEAAFLKDLKVDLRTSQAVTILLAPPGQPVANFAGAVTKDQIVAKVLAGPCASGNCGPGGCGPKK